MAAGVQNHVKRAGAMMMRCLAWSSSATYMSCAVWCGVLRRGMELSLTAIMGFRVLLTACQVAAKFSL